MRLEAGAHIGHYEVVSLIGEGGMGEVYKARDIRLDRTVALKVLHTPDAGLRERFEREARVVAALQHPHICALIDIGNHDGVDYLVMEYLEGKTLTCPQPFGKVLEYGVQLADALDAVHRRGVIHRDLKPANIIVTSHGVKVLDFGIARMTGQDTVTRTGVAIGTPAYMAPEQWKGVADHRTDIFALGCVLYEMAAGVKPSEKPLEPPRLDWLVRGCLAAEPDDRWQSARDVKRVLASIAEPVSHAAPRRRDWFLPAAVAVAALAGLLSIWLLRPTPARQLLQLSIAPPPNTGFLVARNVEGGISVSPDGRMLAFTAQVEGRAHLWLRRLDSLDAETLSGTDGAYFPFWSPDSKWIAFYTPERLMKVSTAGGAPQTVCATDPRVTGGSWGAGDVLVLTDVSGNLSQVPAVGGTPVPLFPGDWPHFLPDGRRFLFQRDNAVWIGSVDNTVPPRRLIDAPATRPAYSLGHVLFIRRRTLMAQRIDPASLQPSGLAFPVAESVASLDGLRSPGEFSPGPDGLLVYAAGDRPNKLVWRDRSGKLLDELTAPGTEVATPRISPDGRRVAFARADRDNMDIWVADLNWRSMTRLTFDPAIDRYPVWSRDGTAVTFASGESQSADLYRKASDGTGDPERLTSHPSPQHAMDWSSDGQYLSFTRNEKMKGTDLMILPAGGQPYVFLQTTVSEAHSQFSPAASRWIAYSSDDSGRREIYIKSFLPGKPSGAARWQISTAGGTMPRWRGDGKELYYWALDGTIMSAAVDGSGSAFQWSAPRRLFQVQPPMLRTNDISFDVTPDGQRFLIVEPVERAQSQPLILVTDWLAVTKRASR